MRTQLYAYWAGEESPPIDPYYALYMLQVGHLSPSQISLLFGLWWAIKLLAELPAGFLADRYHIRKQLLVVAQVLRAGCFAVWLFVPNGLGFAVGFVLRGAGTSFISGTYQALVYDELGMIGQAHDYGQVISRAESWGYVTRMCAKVVAVTAMIWAGGYPTILVLSVASALITAAIGASLPASPRQLAEAKPSLGDIRRTAQREIRTRPRVMYYVAFAGFVGGLFVTLDEFRALLIQEFGSSVALVPLWLIVVDIPVTIGARYAYRWQASRDMRLVAPLALLGPVLLCAGLFGGVIGGVGLSLFVLIMRSLGIIYDTKLQAVIPSSARATVTSIKGLVAMLVAIVLFLVDSQLANHTGGVLTGTAILALVAAVGFGRIARRL